MYAEYNNRYEPRLRLRLSLKNIKRNGNLLNLPLFLCDWLSELLLKCSLDDIESSHEA